MAAWADRKRRTTIGTSAEARSRELTVRTIHLTLGSIVIWVAMSAQRPHPLANVEGVRVDSRDPDEELAGPRQVPRPLV